MQLIQNYFQPACHVHIFETWRNFTFALSEKQSQQLCLVDFDFKPLSRKRTTFYEKSLSVFYCVEMTNNDLKYTKSELVERILLQNI